MPPSPPLVCGSFSVTGALLPLSPDKVPGEIRPRLSHRAVPDRVRQVTRPVGYFTPGVGLSRYLSVILSTSLSSAS